MKDFWDYVVKNKYIIICVGIVVILYALGIVELLTKVVILIVLIGVAVFVGKMLQDHEGNIKDLFGNLKNKAHGENVYYYQNSNDDKKD